jgi:tetratricopeptide (TPR) repeat protein
MVRSLDRLELEVSQASCRLSAVGNPEETLTVLRGIPQGAVDGDVLLSAGKAPHQTGQYDLSAVYYERALSSDDENDDTYFRLGTALAETGDTESAKATYGEVLRLDPTAQDREEDERWIKEH